MCSRSRTYTTMQTTIRRGRRQLPTVDYDVRRSSAVVCTVACLITIIIILVFSTTVTSATTTTTTTANAVDDDEPIRGDSQWQQRRCIVQLNANASAGGRWSPLMAPTNSNNGFCSYFSVPYAVPPLGTRRFEPPQMSELWTTGHRNFDGSSSDRGRSGKSDGDDVKPLRCLQVKYDGDSYERHENDSVLHGSEDCLYLDVHSPLQTSTPQQKPQPSTERLPVVVWIHGGSFNLGWPRQYWRAPDNFVQQNIIVVSVSYRLGALGFLAIPSANISGNYGLLDQRVALQWIRRHIDAFGGNAQRVTLMGWSAGAAAIGYHMMNKSSDDENQVEEQLFQRAIMMSGVPQNPWAVQNDNSKCSRHLLTSLGLTDVPAGDLKARLQQIDADNLIISSLANNSFVFFGEREFGFVPTVDFAGYVRQSPHLWLIANSSRTYRLDARPLMIGHTLVETVPEDEERYSFDDIRWSSSGTRNGDPWPETNGSWGTRSDVLRRLQTFVLTGKNEMVPLEARRRTALSLETLGGLAVIKFGIWRFAQNYERLTNGCVPIVYQFAFTGGVASDFRKRLTSWAEGPVHGDELAYLFGSVLAEADRPVSEQMQRMWFDFIKSTSTCQQPSAQMAKTPLQLFNIAEQTTQLSLDECMRSAEFRFWSSVHRCLYEADCERLHGEYLEGNVTMMDVASSSVDVDARCRL